MSKDPLVLSASSIATFLRCGHQWFLAYVMGVKSPPSLRQARGIALHRAVEIDMLQKVTTREDLPVADMLDAFDTEWTLQGSDGFQPDREDPGDVKDAGYELTRLYHREVAPTIQPVWVEQPVQFTIDERIVYSGQVDIGDEMGRIRDTKSTTRRPRPEQYLLGMTGYALAGRQATGTIEEDTILDYLVATKTPYYLPVVSGGPVSEDSILRFLDTVQSVGDTIAAERFVPNGLTNGACSYCGYRDICTYKPKEL